ncbi:MAG TPA: hypothetical protein VEH53_08570 [archaeon]|nr:hypothetical protein [archaeon]
MEQPTIGLVTNLKTAKRTWASLCDGGSASAREFEVRNGSRSGDEKPDRHVRNHPGKILVSRKHEFPVLDGNGGHDQVRDANSNDAFCLQATSEPYEVAPEPVALWGKWQSVKQRAEAPKVPLRSRTRDHLGFDEPGGANQPMGKEIVEGQARW